MGEAVGGFRALQDCTKPVIAAVHGYAFGGGCEPTLVADLVSADETAKFGLTQARVGLIPGLGSAAGLTQANLHWLKLLIMAVEMLDAREAQVAGLVNRLVAAGQHVDNAEALARKITRLAPLSVAVAKQAIQPACRQPLRTCQDSRSLAAGDRGLPGGHRRVQRSPGRRVQRPIVSSAPPSGWCGQGVECRSATVPQRINPDSHPGKS
jgi:enoyl-CoA hydratase/carnithine racemase